VAAAKAFVIRDAHYPGRAAIEAYGNGGFRFAGMSHRGSILCLPSGIHGWKTAPETGAAIDAASLAAVFAEAGDIEILLVGTGANLMPLAASVRERCRAERIAADPMATGAAVRTFNVLLAENRAVAAALLAVE
jgi:uncharacterized protein